MKRLFVSINIPVEIKSRLRRQVEVLKDLFPSARFMDEKNWHITLVFLGYQDDSALIPITKSIQEAANNFSISEINLSNISYGPIKGTPKMLWLNVALESSRLLSPIKIFLEDVLIKNGVGFKIENRIFNAHITLARFEEKIKENLPELPKNFEKLDWKFNAESLDLMESRLSKRGAEYEILQKYVFEGE